MKNTIIVGTRSSKLALWQAEYVAGHLRDKYPQKNIKLLQINTKGDKILDVPLAKIGSKGVFTKEIEAALLENKIDLAVHSLKDLPTELPSGLTIAALTTRADSADALVSLKYENFSLLPSGAKIGTSSLRRRAQLLHSRPDLQIVDLRGNINTRLAKLDAGGYDAIVLAAAGLKRLGFSDRIREFLPTNLCLPAVGQGIMAIEARQDNQEILKLVHFLHDDKSAQSALAERAFLNRVEGGCQVPVGVHATVQGRMITVEAIIASLDGKRLFHAKESADVSTAKELGIKVAEKLLDAGGLAILQEIGLLRES